MKTTLVTIQKNFNKQKYLINLSGKKNEHKLNKRFIQDINYAL